MAQQIKESTIVVKEEWGYAKYTGTNPWGPWKQIGAQVGFSTVPVFNVEDAVRKEAEEDSKK